MRTSRGARGFTLMELMIVVAIFGILAPLAMPTFHDRVVRAQVTEALNLAEMATHGAGAFYAKHRRMPRANAEAGLPPSAHIMGNYVTDVAVREGVIVVSLGHRVNAQSRRA